MFTGAAATNGLSVKPIAGDISSRKPVDDKYNPASLESIKNLHARAWAAAGPASVAGAAAVVSGAGCSNAGVVAGAEVYVNCDDFVAGNATSFPEATRVYFTGKVTVGNNKSLILPVVERLYIRGCKITTEGSGGSSSNCGNNSANAYALSVDGTFVVNSTGYGACPTYTPPPIVPPAIVPSSTLSHRVTEMATLGGPVRLSAGSTVAMCQTFAYLGRSAPTWSAQQRTTGLPNCSTDIPCPAEGTGDPGGTTFVEWRDEGYVTMPAGGGSGSAIYWSAPNRSSGAPSAVNPFEDIALWGESSRASFLKGTGSSRVSGVFFMPNAYVTLLGQGDSTQPLNAQFISRGLSISGQGTVLLKPNPDDSVQTKAPGNYSLIR
jgi:hypothetical protein